MRRIIVHLIRGEAKEVHEGITQDLFEKFDSFPIHERIVPHLTLKRWFELDDKGMEPLYVLLDSFVEKNKQSDFVLKGFDHFGEGVIFVDVDASSKMIETVQSLMKDLHSIEGLTFDEFDVADNHFHATVAMRALKPFDFKEIWEYLQTTKAPMFTMKFDNIAILKREEDKWVPDRIWELAP